MKSMRGVIAAAVLSTVLNQAALGGAMPEFSIPAEFNRLIDEAKEAQSPGGAKAAPAGLFDPFRVIDVLGIVDQEDTVTFQLSHGFTVRMSKDDHGLAGDWRIESNGRSDDWVRLEAGRPRAVTINQVIFNNSNWRKRLEIIDTHRLGRKLFLDSNGIVRFIENGSGRSQVLTLITPAGIRIIDRRYQKGEGGAEATDRQGRSFATQGALDIADQDLLKMTSVEDIKRFCNCGQVTIK